MFMLTPTTTLLFLLVGALAHSVRSPALLSCLTDKGLNVTSSQTSSDWQAATTPYALPALEFSTYKPIVYPTEISHVSNAIQCATQHRVRVSALSGGHSYAASGYGSQNGSLVIDFQNMSRKKYNSTDGTVILEPGMRLGDVALYLNQHGRAMAHGNCPHVGVGGHAGFGGWGFASRSWGLLIDQILQVVLVLPNGNVVRASKTENLDLFWAIRGASSAFGIVVQYTMQTHNAPRSVTRFAFDYKDFSGEQFTKVMEAYQAWGLTVSKEMGIVANVWQGKDIQFTGYYLGSETDFDRVSAPLLIATGDPSAKYIQERDWITALTEASGEPTLSTNHSRDVHDTFYAKSLVVPQTSPITASAFSALANYFNSTNSTGILKEWFIQFELWGGGNSAISSVDPDATAYPHRRHHVTVQLYGRSAGSWSSQATAFVDGLANAITSSMPETSFGAYMNYIDPDLCGWHEKNYAHNYWRLEEIRKKVDPHDLFMKAQNIGAPDFTSQWNAFNAFIMPPLALRGVVTKAGLMSKTATVLVSRWAVHKLTGKVASQKHVGVTILKSPQRMERSKKYLTHDADNILRKDDIVVIRNCPPVSKLKRFKLETVLRSPETERELQKAKQAHAQTETRSQQ
ncbi:hypothetical protein GGX14DRAFT_640035 [Mycena pura]|uniref:FAD-binding PCMH-type domain-containing protein n=1 Tax=Mycena pura TaxID=153505 RepID=A0AAD6YPJ7_9AGAR|nr:hypothetical protein GGX14DRAFT_640035 [Mycena pura]